MAAESCKRTGVLLPTAAFAAADIGARLWAASSSTPLSHAIWDICGVGLAYFLLRAVFGRDSKLFPVIACMAVMGIRIVQSTGAMSVILDSNGILGRSMNGGALMGDAIACIPPMAAIMLLTNMKERLREKQIPLKNVLIAYASATAVFLISALFPIMVLLFWVMMLVISKSGTRAGEAINLSMYLWGGAFCVFVSYAILTVQFAV